MAISRCSIRRSAVASGSEQATGVSRYGNAALVAAGFDPRVAAGFVASSGAGGAKLFRRDFAELLENLASRGGYHWIAGARRVRALNVSRRTL
jgi:hypothetical protein